MTETNSLTAQQLSFFKTFGFLKFPALLADRITDISTEFENVWANQGGGHNGKAHDGKQRSCIVPFIDQSPSLSTLLDDPRILKIATSLLGDDFNYMGSDGNYYVGDTGWHSDGWHAKIRHIKIAFYLDPVDGDSGALRVIPGSHLLNDDFANRLQKDIFNSEENWGMSGSEVPALALETQPGDIVCFNHNIKHASFCGNSARRMFTMNLCQRYPEDQLEDLRNYISGHARFGIERNYGPAMMSTATPERRVHLEQIMANDDHLAELSRQYMETHAEPSRG